MQWWNVIEWCIISSVTRWRQGWVLDSDCVIESLLGESVHQSNSPGEDRDVQHPVWKVRILVWAVCGHVAFPFPGSGHMLQQVTETKKQSDLNLLTWSAAKKQPMNMTSYWLSPCGSLTYYGLYQRGKIFKPQIDKPQMAKSSPASRTSGVHTKQKMTQRNLDQLAREGKESVFSCLLTHRSLLMLTSNIPIKAECGERWTAGFSKCVRGCRWWGKDDRMHLRELSWLQAELSNVHLRWV